MPAQIGSRGASTPRGERARAEIMACAREVLAERGSEDFSLREVARRAGYAPSALYNHFPDRDALVNAVAMESIAVLGRFLADVPLGLPPRERLVALGLAYMRFAREMRPHWQLVFNRISAPSQEWNAYCEVAWPFTEIVAAVRACEEAGVVRRGDTAEHALGLWALAHGLASLEAAHLANMADELSPRYAAQLETFVDGLSPTSGRTRSKGPRR